MKIVSVSLQNFKGCKKATYTFNGKNTTITGVNGSGKTTIFDVVTWILWGKDSLDNAKFEVRPLDENGEPIHNIDIVGSVVFDMEDGHEVELKKTQKENWVKKRGSENPVLQGNVNEYEIDGYPKSDKEFKEYVNSIVSDDLFKMLTNPVYFPNMPWKEQRAVVMKLASKVSDVELAKRLKKFEPLLDELSKAPSANDIKAKYQKSVNELKKKQTEIPIRIDEISNNKEEIDVAELEILKNSLNEQIADEKNQISDTDKQYEEYQKLSDGIMELKFAESDLQKKANEELIAKKKEIQSKIDKNNEYLYNISDTIQKNNREIANYQYDIKTAERDRANLKSEWEKVNSEVFDESTTICPTCNRKLDTDKIESLMNTFDKSKTDRLARIEERGIEAKKNIENAQEMIPKLEQCNEDNLANKKKLEKEVADLEKQLSELPTSIDVTGTEEYQVIHFKLKEAEEMMNKMNRADDIRNSLNSKLEGLQAQLIECEKKIALSAKNVEFDERISELQTELKEVGVKISSKEKVLYLLDEFIKYKLNKISDSINSMFDGVNFKLFDIQLNGGVKEVCECTVNGVPYGSLNNGHRIIAGLQIIKALQKMYGVYLPIFIDNAESVNDFNIPDMDCQLIKLCVPQLSRFGIRTMSQEEIKEFYDYYKELRVEME